MFKLKICTMFLIMCFIMTGCSNNEEKVNKIVLEAEQLLESNDLENALSKYEEIFSMTEDDEYKEKIGEISQELENKNKYILASELLNNGDYKQASEIFEEIMYYSDSEEKLRESIYNLSNEYSENQEYELAIKYFTDLNENELILENQYLFANQLLQQGNFIESKEMFGEISDYKDSKQIFAEIDLFVKNYGTWQNEIIGENLFLSVVNTNKIYLFNGTSEKPNLGIIDVKTEQDHLYANIGSYDIRFIVNENNILEIYNGDQLLTTYTKINDDIHDIFKKDSENNISKALQYGNAIKISDDWELINNLYRDVALESVVEEPVMQPTPEPAIQPEPEPVPESTVAKNTLVGSIESDKYHRPTCRHAKKILPQNEIWFSSSDDAKNHSYVACGVCNPM